MVQIEKHQGLHLGKFYQCLISVIKTNLFIVKINKQEITSVASSVQLDTSFVNILITSGSKFVIIISSVWSDSLIDFGLSKVNKYLI